MGEMQNKQTNSVIINLNKLEDLELCTALTKDPLTLLATLPT